MMDRLIQTQREDGQSRLIGRTVPYLLAWVIRMHWFDRDKSNVVSLARAPALVEIEAYWQALRGGRAMPLRSEVDPRGILGALPDAFILEQVAPTVARIRVAGSHIGDLLGMEPRGLPVSCLIMPAAREAFGQILQDVLTHPATAQVALGGDTGLGKPGLVGQMILLPLRSDGGEANRILGCLATQGRPGRGPRRFHVTGSALRRIRHSEADPAPLPATAAVDAVAAPVPRAGLRRSRASRPQIPAATLKDTKAPHLKLVVSEGG